MSNNPNNCDAFSEFDANQQEEETNTVCDSSLEMQRAENLILKKVNNQKLHQQQQEEETMTPRSSSTPAPNNNLLAKPESDAGKSLINNKEGDNPSYLDYLKDANSKEYMKEEKFRHMTQLAMIDSKELKVDSSNRYDVTYNNHSTAHANSDDMGHLQQGDNNIVLFLGTPGAFPYSFVEGQQDGGQQQQLGDNNNNGTTVRIPDNNNNNNNNNIVPSTSTPGAFPYSFEGQQDGGHFIDQFDSTDFVSAAAEQQASSTTSSSSSTRQKSLVVANPVPELPTAQFAEAQDDEEVIATRDRTNKNRKKKYALLVMAGCLLIAVAAVLVSKGKDSNFPHTELGDKSSQEINTTSIIEAPPLTPKEEVLLLLPEVTTSTIQQYNDSAQSQALEWLLSDPNFSEYPDWRKVQRFSLAAFYYSAGGPGWSNNTGWLDHNMDECNWYPGDPNLGFAAKMNPDTIQYGLLDTFPKLHQSSMCGNHSSGGRIEQLVFIIKNLQGSVPEELYLLTNLKYFASIGNSLHATIPSTIGGLSQLEFLLHVGGLHGSIPTEIGLTSSLTHFVVFRNELTGSFPTEMGELRNLRAVMADENQLSGKLPSELGLLSDMIWWSTHTNQLSGSIPKELPTSLRMFALYENLLTGPLTSQIGLLTAVEDLTWRHNLLTGSIPTQVGKLERLKFLSLKANQLTGSLPPQSFGTLTKLSGLHLAHNKLTGVLPSQFGLMESILYLDLEDNRLSGEICTELGAASQLERFEIFGNLLTGRIPTQVALLPNLGSLRLDTNQITGTIPLELEYLGVNGSLTGLNVANNSMSGTIPEGLCSLGVWGERGGLFFDCGEQLCGCCWCPCSNVSMNTCQH